MIKTLTRERRQAIRAKRIISLQYRLVKGKNKDGDKHWFLSTTQDMSVLGLSFLSEACYQVDDLLEINVVMSGVLDIYQGYGRVARIEKKAEGPLYLVGVEFVDDEPAQERSSVLKKTVKRR